MRVEGICIDRKNIFYSFFKDVESEIIIENWNLCRSDYMVKIIEYDGRKKRNYKNIFKLNLFIFNIV